MNNYGIMSDRKIDVLIATRLAGWKIMAFPREDSRKGSNICPPDKALECLAFGWREATAEDTPIHSFSVPDFTSSFSFTLRVLHELGGNVIGSTADMLCKNHHIAEGSMTLDDAYAFGIVRILGFSTPRELCIAMLEADDEAGPFLREKFL